MATKAAGANWTHSICGGFRRHQLLKKTTIVHRHTAERTAACSGCIHSYQGRDRESNLEEGTRRGGWRTEKSWGYEIRRWREAHIVHGWGWVTEGNDRTR